MKKIIISIIVIIIFIFILSLSYKSFVGHCFGDVCMGPDKLIYPFIKLESLCNFVGGRSYRDITGWGYKKYYDCEVINPEVCSKNNGYIYIRLEKDDMTPEGYCAKKK